jgi:K+-transporting ATPase c subunit
MRYVIYVLLITMLGVVWLNNSSEGRKIKHRMDAVGNSNAAQYRGD